MARDEFEMKLHEARKAVEEYERERVNESYSPSERLKVQNIQKESKQLIIEAKTIGAASAICPYCGGIGRV